MFERIKLRKDNFVENVQAGDKKARRWLIIYIGIAVFIAVGIYGLYRMNRGYKTFEVSNVIDKNDDVSVNYQVVGDGLIRYSKDGASCTDKKGRLLWNQTFEMSNAQVAACGDYMAIGDIGSNQMRIFNQAGQIAVVNALYPIAGIEIASQGVVAATLTDSDDHYIVLYDATGKELVKIKATINRTGYPVDIALSEDGTKLAVSYLVISGGDVTTRIVFYKFGKTSDSGNAVAGTYDYTEIFPKVEFINNNTLVAFGENGFEIFSMKDEEPEVVLEKVFDNDIKSIFYNEQYIGFVFKNDGGTGAAENMEKYQSDETESQESGESGTGQSGSAAEDSESGTGQSGSAAAGSGSGTDSGQVYASLSENPMDVLTAAVTAETESTDYSNALMPEGDPENNQTEPETTDGVYPSLNQTAETAEGSALNSDSQYRYKMLVYTNAGKLYLDKEFNFDYHSIVSSIDEIILYNENECLMIEYSGKEKFQYIFESRINSLLPKKSKNEYIIIDDNTIKEIRLK